MKSLLHSFLLFFACVGCAHATPLWSQQEIIDVLDEVIETAVGIDFGVVENSSAEPVQEPLWATPRCHLPQSSFWSEVYDRYGDSYATTLGGFRSSTANAITDGLDSKFWCPVDVWYFSKYSAHNDHGQRHFDSNGECRSGIVWAIRAPSSTNWRQIRNEFERGATVSKCIIVRGST